MASDMQDEDATNPFWPNTTPTTDRPYTKDMALRDSFVWWYEKFSNRTVYLNGNQTFGAIVAGTTDQNTIDGSVMEFLNLYRETNGTNKSGVPMERALNRNGEDATHRVIGLQRSDPTQAAPRIVGLGRRVAGLNSGTPGLWGVYLYPIPDQTYYISARVKPNPYVPNADTDYLDCSEGEARTIIVKRAAIMGSLKMGNRQLAMDLLQFVPQDAADAMAREFRLPPRYPST